MCNWIITPIIVLSLTGIAETRITETVGHILNCLAHGGLQCLANQLPTVPDLFPAGTFRRGPYGGVCTCLTNIGGCYIDAAKPPGPGFTCTCIKQEGVSSGRLYACTGVGYRLARGEEDSGGTDDLEQCMNGATSVNLHLVGVKPDCGGYMEAFSEKTWAKIQKDVKIRLFAPNTFHPVEEVSGSYGSCRVWEQGQDIYCKLQGGARGKPHVRLPDSYNSR